MQRVRNINAIPDSDGFTALMWNVRRGDPYILDAVIEAGADVKSDTNHCITALLMAVDLK